MFTTCNECGTVFRVSSAELRVAEGQVRCGHCSATFNALVTLTDEAPPTTILPQLTIPAHLERQPPPAGPDIEPVPVPEPEPEPDISALDTITGDETLEFNVPEDNWSDFFVEATGQQPPPAGVTLTTADEDQVAGLELELEPEAEPPPTVAGGADTASINLVPEDWQHLLNEAPDEADEVDEAPVYRIDSGSADLTAEPEPATEAEPAPFVASAAGDMGSEDPDGITEALAASVRQPNGELEQPVHPVPRGHPFEWRPAFEPPAPPPRRRRLFGLGATILALALVLQLIHYRRDELAARPVMHAPLSRAYAALNLSLLPDWNLNAYEVRGSEAVAGATTRGALDVLARIAVVGTQPVGLPMVRVSLHDRFSKSLGSRVFTPDEYLDDIPQPAVLLAPGYLIPVRISLRDPGTEAFGYEVDVCVLYRKGLVCQQERDQKAPFTR
jgi:predicted Zn finger-like uncharacterized protein